MLIYLDFESVLNPIIDAGNAIHFLVSLKQLGDGVRIRAIGCGGDCRARVAVSKLVKAVGDVYKYLDQIVFTTQVIGTDTPQDRRREHSDAPLTEILIVDPFPDRRWLCDHRAGEKWPLDQQQFDQWAKTNMFDSEDARKLWTESPLYQVRCRRYRGGRDQYICWDYDPYTRWPYIMFVHKDDHVLQHLEEKAKQRGVAPVHTIWQSTGLDGKNTGLRDKIRDRIRDLEHAEKQEWSSRPGVP